MNGGQMRAVQPTTCQCSMHSTDSVPGKGGGAAAEAMAAESGSDSNFLQMDKWCSGTVAKEIKHEIPKENVEDLKAKLLKALEENIRLRSVIHDVTEVNKRWQKYNQERTEYVQQLLSTIKELQQKELPSFSDSSNRSHEASGNQAGKWENLRVVNMVLQKQLEDSERACRLANETLAKISQELNEQIKLLNIQVKMQAEDFMTERKEKKAAAMLAEKHREDFVQLSNKIRDIENNKGQCKVYICVCKNNYEKGGSFCRVAEYQRMQRSSHLSRIQVLPCQLIPRTTSAPGLSSRRTFEESLTDEDRDSAVSLSSPPHSAEPKGSSEFNESPINKWFLVCPKCRKHFSPNLGLQFTSHVDKCQEVMLRRLR